MIFKFWPEDTIARRFALTVVLSIVVAVALAVSVTHFAGVWARPSAHELGLFERADDIVRMVEATPEPQRQAMVNAADNATFRVDWYPAASTVAVMLDAASDRRTHVDFPEFPIGDHPRRTIRFSSHDQEELLKVLHFERKSDPNAYFAAVELGDASWIVFTAPTRVWGLGLTARVGFGLGLLIMSIAAVSTVATLQLARPIREFTNALRRFGTDTRAAPIPESGPREVRASIRAFNAMQAQIQRFVDDRTAMLAAISHDLRTPLTRMRLRGEFVEDEEQRARLFRDVDEMQTMVESALAFFRDDFQGEETTTFDLPELLRTIAEDYSDRGCEITYSGPEHVTVRGRPFALKRAFENLVDNAVKYGRKPELELRCCEQQFVVVVRDSGPGIPPEAAEKVSLRSIVLSGHGTVRPGGGSWADVGAGGGSRPWRRDPSSQPFNGWLGGGSYRAGSLLAPRSWLKRSSTKDRLSALRRPFGAVRQARLPSHHPHPSIGGSGSRVAKPEVTHCRAA